jgi:hypothetical protein
MRDSNSLNSEIYLVCFDCGKQALSLPINKGKMQLLCSTVHNGICDVCGKKKPVSEARDFGYPVFPDLRTK